MQGLYNVDNTTKIASTTSTWIEPGIHENLKLVDIKYDKTKNGNEFLAFYVENENGDKVSNTEWPFTMRVPLDEMSDTQRDTALSIIENQKSKVRQIVEIFKPNFNINAGSFKEFAEKTIDFLGDSYKDTLFRLKVVYDKRGYTTFAQSARFIFMESMDVAKEDSKIRIVPTDRMDRPEKDTADFGSKQNPLDIEEVSQESTSTSPF